MSTKSRRDHAPASEAHSASERSYLSVLPARKVSLNQRVPAPHQVHLGEVSTRQTNTALVAFDERHSPVFVTSFVGRLDFDAVAWHDTVATKAIVAAVNSGRRIVHIVDARRIEVPNAQLRRHWATRIHQTLGTLDAMLGNFVVVDGPLLRGALSAIDWLCPESHRIEYFSTLSDAVVVANLRLSASGVAPTDLDATNYHISSALEYSSTV